MSIRFEVLNTPPRTPENPMFVNAIRCKNFVTIPVFVSSFIELPFNGSSGTGHKSSGKCYS